MANTIKNCPICNGELYISVLQCKECNLELKGKFENDCSSKFNDDASAEQCKQLLENFEKLNGEQLIFLRAFLECEGKLSSLQEKMNINYLSAKKLLAELLDMLGLKKNDSKKIVGVNKSNKVEVIDMKSWNVDKNSIKASEIIKSKLKAANGRATVLALTEGKTYDIMVIEDDRFYCNELISSPKYDFGVFNAIVELLKKSDNGSAKKGNGRLAKLGQPGCEEDTVVGCIAKYMNKNEGEAVDDPVFVVAAILDWAGIAKNERGKITLTSEYKAKCFEAELLENAEIAKMKYGYNATYYLRMIRESGGVEAARTLIRKSMAGSISEGFLKLVEYGEVGLSMESSICNPLYQELFTDEEIQFCREMTQMHKNNPM